MTKVCEITLKIEHDIYEWIEKHRNDNSLDDFVNMVLRASLPEHLETNEKEQNS